MVRKISLEKRRSDKKILLLSSVLFCKQKKRELMSVFPHCCSLFFIDGAYNLSCSLLSSESSLSLRDYYYCLVLEIVCWPQHSLGIFFTWNNELQPRLCALAMKRGNILCPIKPKKKKRQIAFLDFSACQHSK